MAYEFLSLEQEGAVAVVTINRPAVLNALSEAVLREIRTRVRRARR